MASVGCVFNRRERSNALIPVSGADKSDVLKPFPKQVFVSTCLQYMTFENTMEKEEIARNEQFLLFPPCFLSI